MGEHPQTFEEKDEERREQYAARYENENDVVIDETGQESMLDENGIHDCQGVLTKCAFI